MLKQNFGNIFGEAAIDNYAFVNPDKINLASLGNMVPHLHWHVIPRFRDDRHFPEPIWGAPQRNGAVHAAPPTAALARSIAAALTHG